MAKAKTKLKFDAGKAKSAKSIKEKSKRGGGFGNMVWIPKDGSKVLRILTEPKDWIEYNFVMIEETDDGKKLGFRGKLPCYAGFEQDVPEAGRVNARVGFVLPVVVIEDGKPQKQVMFYEPPKKVLNDLLAHFERRKTVTDRDWEIIKEGSGRDTTYTLMADDPKKRGTVSKMASEWLESDDPSFTDELVRMVNEFTKLYNAEESEEDADDDDEPKSKKGKSKAAKKRAMVEDDDDDDDADDDDEPEEDDDADDDDDDDSDDDDSDDDDDAPDYSEMELAELKVLCKQRGIKIKKGQKANTLRKLLEEADAEAGDDDDEEPEEPEADDDDSSDDDGDDDGDDDDEGDDDDADVTSTFKITEIDAAAHTVDATDVKSKTDYEIIYLDRNRDDLEDISEGKQYTFTIRKDEEGDWCAVTPLKPAKKGKK